MCQHCWSSYGAPVSADDEVLALAHLIERLYDMPGCGTGGPLHDVLDDMNIDGDRNGNLRGVDIVATWHGRYDYLTDGTFDRWASASPLEKQEIIDLCEAIVAAMDMMTEGQRAAAIAWREGWIGAAMPEYAARVFTPERRERVEADAQELLDKARALPPVEERPDPNAPQACAPVPCPPFRDVTLDVEPPGTPPRGGSPIAHAVQAVSMGRVDGVLHPGYGMRFAPGAKIDGPFEDIRILPDGSAAVSGLRIDTSGLIDLGSPMFGPVVPGDDAKPTFKWAEYTITNGDGTAENVRWDAETLAQATAPPRVDLAEVLRQQPPQVTYSHEGQEG